MTPSSLRRFGILAVTVLIAAAASAVFATDKSEFARTTIDIGMVVGDATRSAKFYTEAIGFKEGPGFNVSSDFCADAGLDNQTLDIHVLTLGSGPTATKLKLMAAPGGDSKKTDTTYVHSQLGYRYLTIYVADANAALERLTKAGVKPLGKGPVPLPAGLPAGMALCVVRDPDGNMIELIGPKR